MNRKQKIERLAQQWVSLGYAMDQIDLCFLLDSENSDDQGRVDEAKRAESRKHWEVIRDLRDELLNKKYAYEELEKE